MTRFATGALFAAVLTALPETIIAVLSPVHGSADAMLVGMGSVLAAPAAVLFWSGDGVGRLVARNYVVFAVFIASAVGFSLLGLGVYRIVLGFVYLFAYVWLARSMLLEEGELMEFHGKSLLERLTGKTSTLLIWVQLLLSSTPPPLSQTVSPQSAPQRQLTVLAAPEALPRKLPAAPPTNKPATPAPKAEINYLLAWFAPLICIFKPYW